MTLSYTEFISSSKWKFMQYFNSHKQFVGTPVLLPPSLQVIGLEYVNSLACPPFTATESHKSFCLLCRLRQSPCDSVWVVLPCSFGHYWFEHCRQVFLSTTVFCCNDQLIAQPHELVEICLYVLRFVNMQKLPLFYFSITWGLTWN